jgi:hypothetical protein
MSRSWSWRALRTPTVNASWSLHAEGAVHYAYVTVFDRGLLTIAFNADCANRAKAEAGRCYAVICDAIADHHLDANVTLRHARLELTGRHALRAAGAFFGDLFARTLEYEPVTRGVQPGVADA